MSDTPRRTLKYIDSYPTPQEIYDKIVNSQGWPYKTRRDFYLTRDRALVSLLYLLALRISEALRLKREQFLFPKQTKRKDRITIRGIRLSKSRYKDRPRREQYRQEAFLPLDGERASLTQLAIDYLELLEPKTKLFKFSRTRAWQITESIMGIPNHWLRAFGEDYLYHEWDHDLLAVSDYVKIDPRTLQHYIRKRYSKYDVV